MKKNYLKAIKVILVMTIVIVMLEINPTLSSEASSLNQVIIRIPKTIITTIEPNGNIVEHFDIERIGNIERTKKIEIKVDSSFLLKSKGKESIKANIIQSQTTFTNNNSGKQIICIEASDASAGVWNGAFNFTINFSEVYGLYDSSDNLIKPWNELLAEHILHVDNGIVTSQFNPNDSSNSSANVLKGKLIIPDYVKTIGKYAFYNCTNLTQITMKNIKKIDDYGFYGCSGLQNVDLGSGLVSIGEYGFYYCVSMNKIKIPNTVIEIKNNAFRNCSSLTEMILPNSVELIGKEAFYYCLRLERVQLPESIQELEDGIFKNCSSLNEIMIPSSVTEIKKYAFFACERIQTLQIPSSVKEIGNNAFFNVPSVIYNGTAQGFPWGAKEVKPNEEA